MANPDLAAGFSNPKVQAAIMDISANPMNMTKYHDQPEVHRCRSLSRLSLFCLPRSFEWKQNEHVHCMTGVFGADAKSGLLLKCIELSLLLPPRPQIMKVLNEVTEVFKPQMPPNAR